MWGKLRTHLTDDARYWYKLWSSWLAIIWGVIIAGIMEEPTALQQFLSVLPAQYRSTLPPVIGVIAAALPIFVRLIKQGKLARGPDC